MDTHILARTWFNSWELGHAKNLSLQRPVLPTQQRHPRPDGSKALGTERLRSGLGGVSDPLTISPRSHQIRSRNEHEVLCAGSARMRAVMWLGPNITRARQQLRSAAGRPVLRSHATRRSSPRRFPQRALRPLHRGSPPFVFRMRRRPQADPKGLDAMEGSPT